MKRWPWLLSVSAICLLTAGCGPRQTANQAVNTAKSAADVALNNPPARTGHGIGMADPRRMQVETKIADAVVKRGYAQSAYVFAVGNSAFVAVQQKRGIHHDLTNAVKTQIATEAKRVDHNINTVYVTANPDVYQRFGSFVHEVQMGRPISGLWDNFRTIVLRVWPTAH